MYDSRVLASARKPHSITLPALHARQTCNLGMFDVYATRILFSYVCHVCGGIPNFGIRNGRSRKSLFSLTLLPPAC